MGDTTPTPTRSYYGPTRADEKWMAERGSNGAPAQDDPRKRAIASPFGMFPAPPAPVPGFAGYNAPQADQAPSLMDNLWASLSSGDAWKQGAAETLGAPVDGLGWLAHRIGLSVPGGEAPRQYMPSPGTDRQPWIPGASVPLSSRNIRGMLDNPPDLSLMLQAMRRRGLF